MLLALQIGPLWIASPWMLAGCLAAAAPIVIHLLNRQRHQQVPWAAMRFLMAALERQSRRLRLEQWLLLAVRTLAVLLLFLAMSDISLREESAASPAESGSIHTLQVLVIDGSYSLAARSGETTAWDRAKSLAKELVDAGALGNGYCLLVMEDRPKAIIESPAFDGEEVKQELDALQLGHGGANLPAALVEAERVLKLAKQQYPRLQRARVVIFSDMQRVTWSEMQLPVNREQLKRLSREASVVVHDLHIASFDNLAVTGLELSETPVTVAREIQIRATIQNFGGHDRTEQLVELLVDDQPVRSQQVNVPAGETAVVNFAHLFPIAGEHVLQVRTNDDVLPIDDRRWMSVPVRTALRVLCVAGQPGEARPLALALAPARESQSRVQRQIATESALADGGLNAYDAVFICNVERFGPPEAGALHDYLMSGGGVVFFLGDRVLPANYNQQLGGEEHKQRVLPAQLGAASSLAEKPWPIHPLQYASPIVRQFRGHEEAGLLSSPIWKYQKLVPYANSLVGSQSQATVALGIGPGDPLIVHESLGRGRSIVVATASGPQSVDRSVKPPAPWNAWSTWPSFPPVVQGLLDFAASGRVRQQNVLVDQPLGNWVPASAVTTPLTVTSPDRRVQRVTPTIEGRDGQWTYDDTRLSGVYEVQSPPHIAGVNASRQIYVANVDTRESDLRRMDVGQLPPEFLLQSPDEAGTQHSTLEQPESNSISRWLLLAVLALVASDVVLAWRFGGSVA